MISIGTLKMGIEFISVSAPEVKLILPRVTVRNLRPAGLTVTLLAVLQWRLTSPPTKLCSINHMLGAYFAASPHY